MVGVNDDRRDPANGGPRTSGVELLARTWPVLLTAAALIGTAYVSKLQIAESAMRIDALEKAGVTTVLGAQKRETDIAELRVITAAQSTEMREVSATLRSIERKLDRLCVRSGAKCGGGIE